MSRALHPIVPVLMSLALVAFVACSDNDRPTPGSDFGVYDTAPHDTAPHDTAPHDTAPHDTLLVDQGSVLDTPETDLPVTQDLPAPSEGPPPTDLPGPMDLPPPPPKGLPVDLLFVIDNSGSMQEEQQKLVKNFPALIDALRRYKLGPDGSGKPCTATDTSGCNIPDLRIGIVTTDLGAGNYGLPSCEVPGGDGGKLQNKPRVAGCKAPWDPWIAYSPATKTSNVPGTTPDHLQRVKDAFACIAPVGIGGCGFEQPLEAARRALDPTLTVNPGFIRKNAILAVIFISDEDDCSAQNPQLFDPQQSALGPLSSFRCFEFGVTCDINDRNKVGPRKNCHPANSSPPWLHPITGYDAFFKGLKQPGWVVLGAITGPAYPVAVGKNGSYPMLEPSCSTVGAGSAVPAIRIQSLVDHFWGHTGNICDADYAPTLKAIGALVSP